MFCVFFETRKLFFLLHCIDTLTVLLSLPETDNQGKNYQHLVVEHTVKHGRTYRTYDKLADREETKSITYSSGTLKRDYKAKDELNIKHLCFY